MNKTDKEKILFLDIETAPVIYRYHDLNESARDLWNKKWQFHKDVPPDEHYAKAGIYAEFAKVICIGLGYFKEGKFRVQTLATSDEKKLLNDFSEFIARNFNTDRHLLCAHNGKEFDYPFLCRRFIINGVPLPRMLQLQGMKPWNVPHIDTMELWKFGDVKNYTSLNLLAHVLGLPSPKDEMDGSQVGKTYHEENNLDKIADYCKKDVITLARVYNRFAGSSHIHDEDILHV
jgi:3'-5' exonuclease